MKKRYLVLGITLSMAVLSGCGNKNEGPKVTVDTPKTSEVKEDTVEEVIEEVKEETVEPTVADTVEDDDYVDNRPIDMVYDEVISDINVDGYEHSYIYNTAFYITPESYMTPNAVTVAFNGTDLGDVFYAAVEEEAGNTGELSWKEYNIVITEDNKEFIDAIVGIITDEKYTDEVVKGALISQFFVYLDDVNAEILNGDALIEQEYQNLLKGIDTDDKNRLAELKQTAIETVQHTYPSLVNDDLDKDNIVISKESLQRMLTNFDSTYNSYIQ